MMSFSRDPDTFRETGPRLRPCAAPSGARDTGSAGRGLGRKRRRGNTITQLRNATTVRVRCAGFSMLTIRHTVQ